MYPDTQLYIDGMWRGGSAGQTIDVLNPATNERLGTVAHAEIDDLDQALAAAAEGFRTWRAVPALDRSGSAARRTRCASGLAGSRR